MTPATPPSAPKVESLTCPGCGAPLPVRSMGRAVVIVCSHCHSILDAKSPQLTILQRFHGKIEDYPMLIPLGTRGKWRGTVYEVIGFQRREMMDEGITYGWHEYLLFNPYKGFRYFTEFNGHWNDASVVTSLPEVDDLRATYLGKKYKHFQTCQAVTRFVLGEFPWQVSINDWATVTDYVSPPYVLSSETVDHETTWTLGEYIQADEIWKSFQLPGRPPAPVGVFENQPSKSGISAGQIWYTFLALAAAASVILILNENFAQQKEVFEQTYHFTPSPSNADTSFVTPVFELKGRTSSVQVLTMADVSNQWLYLNYALIEEDTGQAYDFGREVSYYFGRDSDGSWTEGRQHDQVVLPSIPPGHYYLRIEPESDPTFSTINYTVSVTRDVPVLELYLAAVGALLLPALLISWRVYNFEQLRWAESDHPRTRST